MSGGTQGGGPSGNGHGDGRGDGRSRTGPTREEEGPGTTRAAPGRSPTPPVRLRHAAQFSRALAASASWAKAFGSRIAMSARIFRLTSIPASFSPFMRRE